MKIRNLVIGILFLIAGCGPILIFPGGELDGETSSAPGDWSSLDDVKTIQLETRPEDPYSVNIWAIGISSHVYIHAGTNRSTWVEHMESNPNIRVRIVDQLYELRASRVVLKPEFDDFSNAYEQKYGSRPRNENVTEAYLFRLDIAE